MPKLLPTNEIVAEEDCTSPKNQVIAMSSGNSSPIKAHLPLSLSLSLSLSHTHTHPHFKKNTNLSIYLYIYILKLKLSIYCCYASVKSHQPPHHLPISNSLSLSHF